MSTSNEHVSSIAQEVVDWFRQYERGLDTMGCDSESMFFADYGNFVHRAEDKRAAAIEALHATMRYVGGGGNDDVVAECREFLNRLSVSGA